LPRCNSGAKKVFVIPVMTSFHLLIGVPTNKYLLLQWQDESNGELQPEPPDREQNLELQLAQEHHLSYNALKGCSGFGTLKFTSAINGLTMQVLVDSGSSDNFLQPRLAHSLMLPIEPIPKFQVLVDNGSALVVEGRVHELEVKIQGHVLKLPVYISLVRISCWELLG